MSEGFRHEALLYRGLDGFLDAIGPLVAATLERGGSAAVAAPLDRLEGLRAQLGDGAGRLALLDMALLGQNPARIIPASVELADAALADGGPFLGVGEPIWAGRGADELDECHRHEALINVAFDDDAPWRLVCPYDVDALEPAVIEDALNTHPTVLDTDGGRAVRPIDALAAFAALERPLSPVPPDALALAVDPQRLGDLREALRAVAGQAGLSAERTDALLLAGTELATNSLQHGAGAALQVWQRDGACLCQTRDAGGAVDPMAGRRRPDVDAPSGRGLWILHQICDLVQVRSGAHGTTVRITVR